MMLLKIAVTCLFVGLLLVLLGAGLVLVFPDANWPEKIFYLGVCLVGSLAACAVVAGLIGIWFYVPAK